MNDRSDQLFKHIRLIFDIMIEENLLTSNQGLYVLRTVPTILNSKGFLHQIRIIWKK